MTILKIEFITIGGWFSRILGLFGFGHRFFGRRLLFIFLRGHALEKRSPIVFHLAHQNLRGGRIFLIWPTVTLSEKLETQNLFDVYNFSTNFSTHNGENEAAKEERSARLHF